MQRITALSSLLFVFVLVFSSSCKKDEPIGQPGELISYELIDSLGLEEIDQFRTVTLESFLETASLKGDAYKDRLSQPKNAVKLYKVTYRTAIPEMGDKPAVATGLIAIPVTAENDLPVISYQHGTVFYKFMVPSEYQYSDETKFMVLQYAAQGYVMIAADYIGLGSSSTDLNSYFARYSNEQACLDMYRASQEVLEDQQISMNRFFISGWSQGAYNTMLFLRRLEQEKIHVDACYAAATPVDPQLFVTRGLFVRRPFDATYNAAALCNLIYGIESYNKLSGVSSRYIRPQYRSHTRDFYEFKIGYPELIDTVPTLLDSVFTEELFADAQSSNGPLWSILADSEAYKWLSPTPLRAYYGLYDEIVPEEIARLGVEFMTTIGKKNAEAISTGALADHRNTFIESIIDAKPWIDSFR